MKVLFATSECAPFVKTGGLGDVARALPAELVKCGIDARVILPKYALIPEEYKHAMRYIAHIYIKMGWRNQYCGVFELETGGVKYYFVDNEFYFGHWWVYGSMDMDIERFAFFSKAVLELLPVIDFKPDVIHCNDWQTAAVPVLLDAHYRQNWFCGSAKTVLTIHNIQFQGIYDWETIGDICDLPKSYHTIDRLEFYKEANLLKGGIVFAHRVTTVSPTYAEEIKYPYYGEKLDGLLREKGYKLSGIVNGIDYSEFNPKTDKYIEHNYDSRNFQSKKRANKLLLQRDLFLEQSEDKMLLCIISRLTSQKGLDLVECVLDDILRMDVQLVVLGTGEQKYENLFRHYAWRYPGRVSAQIKFDEVLSHKIYASGDLFLMPSKFEPCGLSQMIAMHYGTLPVVRETGGLRDTVEPYNEFEDKGTGFSFANYNAHEMLYACERANHIYRNNKQAWNGLVRRAMAQDFSWRNPAKKYIELYASLTG